jgi:hypothetical protein
VVALLRMPLEFTLPPILIGLWVSLGKILILIAIFAQMKVWRKRYRRVGDWALTANNEFNICSSKRDVVGLHRQPARGLIEVHDEVVSRPLAEEAAADGAAILSMVNWRVDEHGLRTNYVVELRRTPLSQIENVVFTDSVVVAHATHGVEIHAVFALAVAISIHGGLGHALVAWVGSTAFLARCWAV